MDFLEHLKQIFALYEHEEKTTTNIEYDEIVCTENEHILPADIYERFVKKGLNGGYKACREQYLKYEEYERYMSWMMLYKFRRRCYGEMLSFMYQTGDNFNWHVIPLLRKLYENNDYDTFLKQCHRFGIYKRLKKEIEHVLYEFEKTGKQDAEAWRSKFLDLETDEALRSVGRL